jgi:hypothetical protein
MIWVVNTATGTQGMQCNTCKLPVFRFPAALSPAMSALLPLYACSCVDIDANCAYYNSKGYCSSTQYAAFMAQVGQLLPQCAVHYTSERGIARWS